MKAKRKRRMSRRRRELTYIAVDEALEQMRTMLDSNEAVQKLIANEAGEGSE